MNLLAAFDSVVCDYPEKTFARFDHYIGKCVNAPERLCCGPGESARPD